MFLRGSTVRSATPIALVVGTILSAINQADIIAVGQADVGTWLRVAADYAVPFLVSSLGYLSACKAQQPTTRTGQSIYTRERTDPPN